MHHEPAEPHTISYTIIRNAPEQPYTHFILHIVSIFHFTCALVWSKLLADSQRMSSHQRLETTSVAATESTSLSDESYTASCRREQATGYQVRRSGHVTLVFVNAFVAASASDHPFSMYLMYHRLSRASYRYSRRYRRHHRGRRGHDDGGTRRTLAPQIATSIFNDRHAP